MSLIVMKFGGTSVGTGERIRQAGGIVRAAAKGRAVVVVVSAAAGVTDTLVKVLQAARIGMHQDVEEGCRLLQHRHETLIAELFSGTERDRLSAAANGVIARLREICAAIQQLRVSTPEVLDMALSLGEEILAQIFAAELQRSGTASEYVDSARVLVTDEHYGEAMPDLELTRLRSAEILQPLLALSRVPVVTGYRGATATGHLTTLGRGGSDFSATAVGAAMKADEVWIWTDVDGVLTADPRLCPAATTLAQITFAEAIELSYYGAKVIHQRAIRPCLDSGIPVCIKNSFRPELEGTRITSTIPAGSPVRAVTAVKEASLVTLSTHRDLHFAEIFGRLLLRVAHEQIDLLFSTQSSSEHVLGLVVRQQDTERVTRAINRLLGHELQHGLLNIAVTSDIAVIAVLGQAMKGVPGILGRLFSAVARRRVSVIAVAQGASELNICFAVPNADAAEVVKAVHEEFFTKTEHDSGLGQSASAGKSASG